MVSEYNACSHSRTRGGTILSLVFISLIEVWWVTPLTIQRRGGCVGQTSLIENLRRISIGRATHCAAVGAAYSTSSDTIYYTRYYSFESYGLSNFLRWSIPLVTLNAWRDSKLRELAASNQIKEQFFQNFWKYGRKR